MTGEAARRIRDDIERSWRPFRDLAESLRPRLDENTPAGWTAKEMLSTIAFWDEAAVGWITIGLRGETLPDGWAFGSGYVPADSWPRDYEHNAREAEWARDRAVDEVLLRCDAAHAGLLEIIETVTDEEAAANAAYFPGLGGHYRDHMPELEALAGRQE
ncbi:MAG TPA: hypothetical protein VNN10_01075 [Dehalococcoidia bacterium]|nr:hypothetical protein [Dehalococcoidia bacterium]